MNTNTTELNLNEMETVNGTGLWDDFKATMGMIGKRRIIGSMYLATLL